MIIPCTVQEFRKAQIGDCCVFKSYKDYNSGCSLAYEYGLLLKTFTQHSTSYGFEITYLPKIIQRRRAGKTKFDTETVDKMHKVLNKGE